MKRTKEELRSYRNELKYIEKLKEQIDELRARAEATTKTISDMPHGGSPDKDKMAGIVARIVDLTRDKTDKTQSMLDSLKLIEDTIEQLPQPYKNILHSAYIQGHSLRSVATECGYEYNYFCRTIHKRALILYKNKSRH